MLGGAGRALALGWQQGMPRVSLPGGAGPDLIRPPILFPAAVLKAEQAAVFKFPLAPLGCSGLGSALLASGPGLPSVAGTPHLPLELQLRGKLEAPGTGESGTKAKKGRRSRTVFTELQLMGLEKRFEKQKYLSTPDRYHGARPSSSGSWEGLLFTLLRVHPAFSRIDLAESLGLSQLQVKTWYQNRRMKWKKIVSVRSVASSLLLPVAARPLGSSRAASRPAPPPSPSRLLPLCSLCPSGCPLSAHISWCPAAPSASWQS